MYLKKRGFVIFLQGPTFWDFIDSRLFNYTTSGIQICFPLFWGIFWGLGSSPIKLCPVIPLASVEAVNRIFYGQ